MRINLISLLACASAMLMAGVSCGNSIEPDDNNNPYKSLDLTTKSMEFVEKGNTFAFNFIDRINSAEKKDYVVSPLSMQFLLGMILDGAKGTTADEICQVLGFGEGQTGAVNEYCLSLLEQLPKMDKKTTLSIADAIFVDDGWPLKKSYKEDVGKYYKAAVENLDFSNQAKALKVINGWCNDNTNGLIPKVLDGVSTDILAYLLNAVYFKSQWAEKFEKGSTADETFTDETGTKNKVKMMKQRKDFGYYQNDTYQAVCLPYGNGVFKMTVFLPNNDCAVADVTKALKKEAWNTLRFRMSTADVDLWLPKFETKYHIELNDILSDMGMPSAFNAADFSAMSDYANSLSFVMQDAVIKVDEEGTEAAAVSTAGIEKNSIGAPGDKVVFHADHPFLYLITESSSGAVLFAGRYSGK